MNLQEFQAFVEQNSAAFRGVHPETTTSLQRAEEALGYPLPITMKWLLSNCGYSGACGVASLEESVEITLNCRKNINLPTRYIILNDWNDVGVVFYDAAASVEGEYTIYWGDAYYIHRLADGENLDTKGMDVFADYPAWVLNRLENINDE